MLTNIFNNIIGMFNNDGMKFTHDFNKVIFYIFMLVITVSYILIFLNTLYMKLFLWKNSQIKNHEAGDIIIPMQEVYDYKLYLNSYRSGYRENNENKCLKANYNNDIVLTTNYNLYLNGLIFKTFFTCIFLYIIIIFIIFCMKYKLEFPNIADKFVEIYPDKTSIKWLTFALIFIPFIYLYAFTQHNLHKEYNLEFKDNPEDFENYLYGEIRELIIKNNLCFNDLKKFFENVNKNNIENYVNANNDELLLSAKDTFEKCNQRPQDICKDYIILCNKLSKINKYTNVDVVKNMRDFLYLCEKAYDKNNSTGYKIDDKNVSLNYEDTTTKKSLFEDIKDNYDVKIIIGTNYKELFEFFNDNKKSIDNTKFDELINKVKNITTDINNTFLMYTENNDFKYSIDQNTEEKLTSDEIINKIYGLYSADYTPKKFLFFDTTNIKFTEFVDTEPENKLPEKILTNKLERCYILSYKAKYDNNDIAIMDTVQCIFYKDIPFAFEKNFGFMGKIFTGNLIEDNDLSTTDNNDYNNNNILFISMLTKNLFNKNYIEDTKDGKYYCELQDKVKNHYYEKLDRNYKNFRDYIIMNGIVFGSFAIIVAYIILQIYYKQTNNKDLTYDINKYLLNTKINKGHDYIINLYASIALSLLDGGKNAPSLYLFIAFFTFIILLFALPYPSNFIALIMIYILPYLIIRYYISTSVITSAIMLIIFITTLIYLIDFLNYAKNSNNENTINNIIGKIVTFTVLIVVIVILIYMYLKTDLTSIYTYPHDNKYSFIYRYILLFIAIILPLGYFVVSILFSLDFYKNII